MSPLLIAVFYRRIKEQCDGQERLEAIAQTRVATGDADLDRALQDEYHQRGGFQKFATQFDLMVVFQETRRDEAIPSALPRQPVFPSIHSFTPERSGS